MTLYQPFLDYASALLPERIDLHPYPIPAGFEQKENVTGKGKKQGTVITTSHAWRSSKLRQIRASHVCGGASLQVLNFVIFPKLEYELPFFGADLVTLPGGHLIAIDMQPLFHDIGSNIASQFYQFFAPIKPIYLGGEIFPTRRKRSFPLPFSGHDHEKRKW
jgi:phycoerythrobilin:ferredoxin oxidoreductase